MAVTKENSSWQEGHICDVHSSEKVGFMKLTLPDLEGSHRDYHLVFQILFHRNINHAQGT